MEKPPVDTNVALHGTNIAWLISDHIGENYKKDFCLIIINYYTGDPDTMNAKNSNKALLYAISVGAQYINYSGGGVGEIPEETRIVKLALNRGIVFVAAAGNEKKNFKDQKYFPALSDSRVIVVGALDKKGNIASFSNFGQQVDVWEEGVDVVAGGVKLSGTSQATAVATGKIVKNTLDNIRRDMIERIRNTANTRGDKDAKKRTDRRDQKTKKIRK